MGDDTATTATATTNTYAVSSIHKDVLRSICLWIFPPESPPVADTTATATATDNNTNTNAATDTNAAAEATAEESKLRPGRGVAVANIAAGARAGGGPGEGGAGGGGSVGGQTDAWDGIDVLRGFALAPDMASEDVAGAKRRKRRKRRRRGENAISLTLLWVDYKP